jgi:hypothetical protein
MDESEELIAEREKAYRERLAEIKRQAEPKPRPAPPPPKPERGR